jgi:hypothetical protein
MTSEQTYTVYVALLDEGTYVWRPVAAEHLGGDIYRLAGTGPDDTETWEFPPTSVVKCESRKLSGGDCLVATEAV